MLVVALVLAITCGFELGLSRGYAPFTASDTNLGNSLAAASSFPTYPQAVTRDGPLAYYRLDDAVGTSTVADSSGNAKLGVLSPKVATDAALYLPFDEGSGTTSKDLSGSTNNVTTSTGAGWTTGKAGSAASLNGTSSFWTTASSVVNTTTSFTVAAWVNMNASPSTSEAAVTQNGVNESGLRLGYDSGSGRWAFTMTESDSTSAVFDRAIASSVTVATGTWVHLAGTFNSSTQTMTVYVNGSAAGTQSHPVTWNATGGVRVGAALDAAAGKWFWSGAVDDVRMYSTALSATDIAALANGTTGGPTTKWAFDENSGTSTADVSGNVNRGTFGSGASWTSGHSGTAVALNYTSNGYVSGSARAVHTNQSFTVSAWVWLNTAAVSDGNHHVAVSESGTNAEGFALEYSTSAGGRWELDMDQTDIVAPTIDFAFQNSVASSATWVNLVGVYDATAGQMSLYVNGALAGTAAHTASFDANQPLQVGRVWEFGNWDPAWAWNGSVDDVKTYQRALSASDVSVLYNGGSLGQYTPGAAGALQGAQQGQTGSTAVAFSGAENGYLPTSFNNPTTFTQECWFRTDALVSGASGATLLDFANAVSGVPTSSDRRLFIDGSGNIVFGSSSGTANTVKTSGKNYLDGAWHHVAATLSSGTGMKLYVDGALVGSGAYSAPGNYSGWWRFGGDTATASFPAGNFLGVLDEVAFYSTVLTATQLAEHYNANH